jgi:hypothetical protein
VRIQLSQEELILLPGGIDLNANQGAELHLPEFSETPQKDESQAQKESKDWSQ